ncbi:hypothetical protein HMPREF1051_0761 [Neisseria sicca VK64]|uniref:Uncharacterized protein n=1 Tax=Neisseria sicca VK64 TaxID=1095748 RepID=I2NQH8_NEISI|nr:hypothetical protein HMPREF1051_0761 [Neisseria sicca VK64]
MGFAHDFRPEHQNPIISIHSWAKPTLRVRFIQSARRFKKGRLKTLVSQFSDDLLPFKSGFIQP